MLPALARSTYRNSTLLMIELQNAHVLLLDYPVKASWEFDVAFFCVDELG